MQDKLVVSGFGRSQEEAFINATKNYLETLVATNTFIPQLKNALKLREGSLKLFPISQAQTKETATNETLDLDAVR